MIEKNHQFIEDNYSSKKIFKKFISMLVSPLKYILPKKIIILSSSNSYSYNGNSRYLFEYLSLHTSYDVFWFTNSTEVKEYLKKKNFKYLTHSNPIKLIFYNAMAKIIFNDGDNYFNIFGLSDTKKTFKISLFHGYGPKTTLVESKNPETKDLRIRRINRFNFINFTSDYLADRVSSDVFGLPRKKAIILGFPKNDDFFDKNISDESLKNRTILKSFFGKKVNKYSRVILYTPTWRPYDYKLPLMDINDFDEQKLNNYLKRNNLFFVYTTHPTLNPNSYLRDSENIKFVDESYHLYDTNKMMMETDILLNDYSTTSVEFSILKRPQIFCINDYNKYNDTKGFIDNYDELMPGDNFNDMDNLFRLLNEIINNESQYIKNYQKQRELLLNKYYNLSNIKSVENYKVFIEGLMNTNKSNNE